MNHSALWGLVDYACAQQFIAEGDRIWAANTLLAALGETSLQAAPPLHAPLHEILQQLLDATALAPDAITQRDLLDTALMGIITPKPSKVQRLFWQKYGQSPQTATDWYYAFCKSTNYIRADRIAKDVRFPADTPYGRMEISINLSKPEKDPAAIAAASRLPQSSYPKCQLCAENEGYAGRLDHPARQNHRPVPLTLCGAEWLLQYSPYVYYNEHCILLNRQHTPMQIDEACFGKLLGFVQQFPHYFVGSNADLPIVGGSILSHEHFQGGRHTFAMEVAPMETEVQFGGFSDITAGIVAWPMSVLRLNGVDPKRLQILGGKILQAWRSYTDEAAFVFAQTNGTPHSTITPIARRRGKAFELDLVLRNNITTAQHPMGVYHPHAELHHIKKENIGLIEVMGLAVLPARLKAELAAVAKALGEGGDLRGNPLTASHADWAEGFAHKANAANALQLVYQQTGKVFATVLEQAGVFARTESGKQAFLRFCAAVG